MPGDPVTSTESLIAAMQNGPLSIIRMEEDRYGGTLALVCANKTDLFCHQLAEGGATYVARWDNEKALRKPARI